MDFGSLRVSRFVLALEMALCFVPLTFGWFDVVFGAVYVAANFVTGSEWSIERVGFYVLFVAVPLAGAAHLMYLGRPQRANTLSAA